MSLCTAFSPLASLRAQALSSAVSGAEGNGVHTGASSLLSAHRHSLRLHLTLETSCLTCLLILSGAPLPHLPFMSLPTAVCADSDVYNFPREHSC